MPSLADIAQILLYGGKGTFEGRNIGLQYRDLQEQQAAEQTRADELFSLKQQQFDETKKRSALLNKISDLKIAELEYGLANPEPSPEDQLREQYEAIARLSGLTEVPTGQPGPLEFFESQRMVPQLAAQDLTLDPQQQPGLAGLAPELGQVPEEPQPFFEDVTIPFRQPAPPSATIGDATLEQIQSGLAGVPGVSVGATGAPTFRGAPAEAPSIVQGRELDQDIKTYKAFGVPPGLEGSPLWVDQQSAIADYEKKSADASMAIEKAIRYPDILDAEDDKRIVDHLTSLQRLKLISEQLLREEFARRALDPARYAQIVALTEAIAKNYKIDLLRLGISQSRLGLARGETGGLSTADFLGMIDDVAAERRSAESVTEAVGVEVKAGRLTKAIGDIVIKGVKDAADMVDKGQLPSADPFGLIGRGYDTN